MVKGDDCWSKVPVLISDKHGCKIVRPFLGGNGDHLLGTSIIKNGHYFHP